jgi:hypothetical protein
MSSITNDIQYLTNFSKYAILIGKKFKKEIRYMTNEEKCSECRSNNKDPLCGICPIESQNYAQEKYEEMLDECEREDMMFALRATNDEIEESL